ncbi:MAG: prepilin-type N-terminal cleavage/methylation domain-containing protein [Proteobacteria bacterium]|nr:prepilin-type N-terminal cleavage/methylation domain-containing protein [Pseudomonadota bacterium]MBS0462658.1 prepilin-type N-terminal cleavage/methylation domain-containing protein [Pseudomonadota bacterium]
MSGVGTPARQRGFTLIEVLVAFALLAVGLGILLAILSSGVRGIANASDSTRASLYAQGLFATLGGDGQLHPGHSQGSFENGRYRWTLEISRYPTPHVTPPPGGAPGAPIAVDPDSEPRLLQVVLTMRWGAGPGHALRVDTLRAYVPPAMTP